MVPGPEFPIDRPKRPGIWEIVARSKKISEQWIEYVNQANAECQRVYDQLSTNPLFEDGDRQQRLAGEISRGIFEGEAYERRQIDITSGGRVWYFVDQTPFGSGQKKRNGRVIIDAIFMGHPKDTEKKQSGKRRPGRK